MAPAQVCLFDVIQSRNLLVEPDEAAERDNQINEYLRRAEVAQPKVVPPRETKSKLYTDPAVFEQLDRHAVEVCDNCQLHVHE